MERRAREAYHLAAILVSCLALSSVEANYTLEILVEGYQNPTHRAKELITFREGCCDLDRSLPCKSCDNAFSFCIREDTTGKVDGDCDIAELETDLIELENDNLMFSLGDDIGGVSNPFIVSGNVWPGAVEIVFTVYDLDLTASIEASSDVVDNIFVYPDIAAVAFPGDSFSNTASFSGNFSRVQLAFRLTCGPDHYGPSCSFYCTNDTDCSFPCVSQPCRNGGTCVFNSSSPHNYTCECGDDFGGDNCEEVNPCASQPCDNGGTCTPMTNSDLEFTCMCTAGYAGSRCDMPCELMCGDNGRCVVKEGGSALCECDEGYTGDLCETSTSSEGGGGGNNLLLIVVAAVGSLLVILIAAVLIAICVLVCRGQKFKRTDDGSTPNPYETPSNFFRKWRGNGRASNGVMERKFDNPLYHEGSISPISPPLPPRPEHPYATLEEMNNPYAQIPVDLESSLDEKPCPDASSPYVEPVTVNDPYDHICHQPPGESSTPRPENPYLNARPVNPASPPNPMNSCTVLYAHIQ